MLVTTLPLWTTLCKLGIDVTALGVGSNSKTVWYTNDKTSDTVLPLLPTSVQTQLCSEVTSLELVSLRGVVQTFSELLEYVETHFGCYSVVAISPPVHRHFPAVYLESS